MTTLSDTTSYFVSVLSEMELDTPVRCAPEHHPAITVVRTDDGVFAIDDTCTHQDTSLSDGWVENCAIECPLHETCFDLRTGIPQGPPATRAVATHPVSVVDGLVYVLLARGASVSNPSAQDATDAA
ncbi:bifunctional 3-phenylpropionate/cinnamic acid dioxygenase ferredoxin subunit [Williamsia phyllosphaerae]|uniref:Rieske domain-containing protein n=1 Tax=Williamsia phyllosphaerae TaxID=885042 RepID=A0ABQ1V898_9NOCA|nr:hypothetical protein GCM10007298_39950 [Williamsia phyllosphaerae]